MLLVFYLIKSTNYISIVNIYGIDVKFISVTMGEPSLFE